jgi:hypothetical protein
MGLTQIQEGAVAWGQIMQANIAFLRLPPRYISGLLATQTSASSMDITGGVCRDGLDQVDMNYGAGGLGPKPACTAALGAGGNVDAGTHSYVVTFVNPLGETLASAVSNTITAAPSTVSLTAIPTSGASNVTARNIYRSKAGNDSTGPWLFLATLSDNSTTSYTDNTADASLGTTAPISNFAFSSTGAGQRGMDKLSASGTVTSVSFAWTGSGTKFTTEFGTRGLALGGTIGTSGSSTTITGTGTRFLDDVQINDLIGVSPTMTRVTAIASDTSLTVSTAVTISAGSTATVVENPVFTTTTDNVQVRVDQITSDTALTTTTSGTHSTPRSFTIGTNIGSTWINLFVVSGSAGTSIVASTQRTKFLNIDAGYATYKRRIGTVRLNGASLLNQYQKEVSPFVRDVFYEEAAAANNTGVLSGGGATSFTSVDVSAAVAPGARNAYATMIFTAPSAQVNGYVRETSQGSATTTRNLEASAANGGSSAAEALVDVDRTQHIDYVLSAAAGSQFAINIRGFRDTL